MLYGIKHHTFAPNREFTLISVEMCLYVVCLFFSVSRWFADDTILWIYVLVLLMLLLFVMFLYIDHFFFEFVCFFFYWVIVNYFKLIAYSTLLSFDANEIISDLGLIFATNQQHILCPPLFFPCTWFPVWLYRNCCCQLQLIFFSRYFQFDNITIRPDNIFRFCFLSFYLYIYFFYQQLALVLSEFRFFPPLATHIHFT